MYSKNEVIYSDGIGVCKVSDIVNLSMNKKPPVQYFFFWCIDSPAAWKERLEYLKEMNTWKRKIRDFFEKGREKVRF